MPRKLYYYKVFEPLFLKCMPRNRGRVTYVTRGRIGNETAFLFEKETVYGVCLSGHSCRVIYPSEKTNIFFSGGIPMRRTLAGLTALCLTLILLSGCGGPEPERIELTVFAAASLTEALTELGNAYTNEHKNVNIVFNFDSSGTLKTQIQEGAYCDVFISAGRKQMDQLDGTAPSEVNTEGLDYVIPDTRFDILENKVALVVPDGNPANINSFADLKAALEAGTILLAMGNSDVPVGQYTQKILTYFGLSEEDLAVSGSITYGSNVKEVTTQVSEAAVDCGIIYQTDAFSAGLTIVDTATAEMCGQVVYPAAVIKGTNNRQASQAFLEYLAGEAADAVFMNIGFSPVD